MEQLDNQMQTWSPRLRDDLGVSMEASKALATTIASDVRGLSAETRASLVSATPVPLKGRVDELVAFQDFMDTASAIEGVPVLARAQVIVQNYVCFVYLGDACFRILAQASPSGCTVKRCCRFLTDNPVRAFRNAIAHGNWSYKPDFSGLVFWARKGADPQEALSTFEVSQNDLNFWQSLARCTAYAAFTTLEAS
jgi:hypothetical protein